MKEPVMATKTTPENPLGVDLGPYEEAATRIRELNERLIESSKAAGNTTLDVYEKALKSLVDFEEKVAGPKPTRVGVGPRPDGRGVRPRRQRGLHQRSPR